MIDGCVGIFLGHLREDLLLWETPYDKSWLNADSPPNTARREKGATKKRKAKTHHTNNNKKVPFQTTKTKRTKRVRLVWPDEPRVVVYIQHHTTTEGAVANREGEREREHLLPCIVVTEPVFHFDTSWLNADASRNTARRKKQQRKERPKPKPPPTTKTTTTSSRFKPQTERKNNTCETCDSTDLQLSYIH